MRMRAAVAALLAVLACASCSRGGGRGGPAASCADLVVIAGTSYVAGRGDGAAPVPRTGTPLSGLRPPCADGNEPSTHVVVHTIPGVRPADAVAGPTGYELLLAERWWQQPRAALPAALQPYVRG